MADILLKKINGYWDIDFTNGDLTMTRGLETAILMSLFVDARASSSEMPDAMRRRGWFGNKLNGYDNDEMGSKLWLLSQSRRTQNTLNLAKTYCVNCLAWLLTDKIADKIDVDVSFIPDGVEVDITVYRSQNKIFNASYNLWENTNLVV